VDSVDYSGKWGTNPTFLKKLFSTDVNNASYDDIILYDWTISTIFSHGDGSFPILNTVEDMGNASFDILADDFNGDGVIDIMTLDGFIYIKYNDGDGQFPTLEHFATEFMAHGVALEDLNDDGCPDIAATQYGTYDGYVSIYLNNQDGTFP